MTRLCAHRLSNLSTHQPHNWRKIYLGDQGSVRLQSQSVRGIYKRQMNRPRLIQLVRSNMLEMLFSCAWMLSIILIQSNCVSCLPIETPMNISSDSLNENSEPPLSSSLTSSRNITAPIQANTPWRNCATPQKWSKPPLMIVEDCQSAAEWLYFEEMDKKRLPREFLSVGAQRTTSDLFEPTPRTYTFGKPPSSDQLQFLLPEHP